MILPPRNTPQAFGVGLHLDNGKNKMENGKRNKQEESGTGGYVPVILIVHFTFNHCIFCTVAVFSYGLFIV